MQQPKRFLASTTATAAAVAALLGSAGAALGALMDISQSPLASSSDVSVLPNVMFLLDDSGSMEFDMLPDYAERSVGGSERRYMDTVGVCKPKGITVTGFNAGRPSTHCDRVDPPFGAAQHNGQYYNPAFTYSPPVNFDGTKFPNATNPAKCDPYTPGYTCDKWYSIASDYYNNGAICAGSDPNNTGCGTNRQDYSNPNVKQWFGTGSTFDVDNQWPEIVYCTSSGGDVNNIDQCRRNGIAISVDSKHTGNPFRYSSALGSRGFNGLPVGSTLPAGLPASGAYPEVDRALQPVNEFTRPPSGTRTTVTVNLGYPHAAALNASNAFQIIPRTGVADFDNSGNPVTVSTTASRFQVTYTTTATTTTVAYGGFDLVVNASRANPSGVITVTNAWNHGLAVGDKLNIFEVSCTSGCGSASLAASNVAVASVVNANSFTYTVSGGATQNRVANVYYRRAELFNIPKLRRGSPHYYTIEPIEYCSDTALTTCVLSSTPTGAFIYPAAERFCLTPFDAYRLDAVSGNAHAQTKPRCRKKYEEASGYTYPRYGQFRRVDVSSAIGLYTDGDRSRRTDCANYKASPASCTFAEEAQNFRNWFQYYRHRLLNMKTSAGLAFLPIDDRYRVGFLTINPNSPVTADNYLKIDKFAATQKKAWYDKFYAKVTNGGTPLPEALSRVGRMYAGKTDGINKGMDDPVQYSCQQNFVVVTTDGYWSQRNGQKIDGSAMDNQDGATSVARPFYDGGSGAFGIGGDFTNAGSLADVALYYYLTDLRPAGSKGALGTDVSENNVPTRDDPYGTGGAKTPNWQHMITYGLGMAEGLMDWRSDYDSKDAPGDFASIRAGASGVCQWTPGTCNWPVPGIRAPGNLDDLWHAAVNGRGKFFYARDTKMVQEGLTEAMLDLQTRNASGAAAATSTPNITPTDRAIFKSSYTTVEWYGDITAQFINPNDGTVEPTIAWSAKETVQAQTAATSDSRSIRLADYTQPNGMKDFLYSNLSVTEKAWFDNKCTGMSQCITLDTTQQAANNSGANLVNFLRGRSELEAGVYRDRQFALGDTVNAVPLYVAKPRFRFVDATATPYTDFVKANASRQAMLYVGANDGMLHALRADTGGEAWAFIPRQVAPNMWALADEGYPSKHRYYVDGSPTFMDVWDGSSWCTILVGGLNAGGRGFYALDITNPLDPKALWEICPDSNLCSVVDADMGFSFGNPVIGKRDVDGRWVVLVTSGYNNVTPGDGKGYLYVLDAIKGTVLQKISTSVGDTTTPAGLGKISGWADNFFVDNSVKWVYGGDQLGNIWKFDLTVSPATVKRLGQALDANGIPQPITTKPELGLVNDTVKVVYVGTGRYLGLKDLSDPATQTPKGDWSYQNSLYAFRDDDKPLGNLRKAGLVQQTIIDLAGGQQRTATQNQVDWNTTLGWYIDFNPGGASPGERVTVDPQLALGTLLVATNVPGATACAVGGDSWIYQFDYKTGSFVYGAPSNLVAKKQTGALTVGMVIYQLQKGSIVGQVQRSETSMRKEDINVTPGAAPSRRTSWREITPMQ